MQQRSSAETLQFLDLRLDPQRGVLYRLGEARTGGSASTLRCRSPATGLAGRVPRIAYERHRAALFWQVVNRLDYWVWYARLRIIDATYRPEPETEADR